MKLFQKSNQRFERDLRGLCNITDMLQEEGKSDGECRDKKFVATLLLFMRIFKHLTFTDRLRIEKMLIVSIPRENEHRHRAN